MKNWIILFVIIFVTLAIILFAITRGGNKHVTVTSLDHSFEVIVVDSDDEELPTVNGAMIGDVVAELLVDADRAHDAALRNRSESLMNISWTSSFHNMCPPSMRHHRSGTVQSEDETRIENALDAPGGTHAVAPNLLITACSFFALASSSPLTASKRGFG